METIVINSDLTKCVEEEGFVDLLPRYFQLKMGHTQKFQSVKFLIMQEMTFSVKSSLILWRITTLCRILLQKGKNINGIIIYLRFKSMDIFLETTNSNWILGYFLNYKFLN